MKLIVEKELFQWEKNRYVHLISQESDPTITYIQFYNSKVAYGPEVPLKSGKAKIPNSLLVDGVPLTAIACTGTKGNTKPIVRKEFNVIRRARPSLYYEDLEDSDEPDIPDVPDVPEQPDSPGQDGKDVVYDGGEEV